MICKNCNHKFSGKFCNNCGQSKETHPINLHFIWHDIQHGLFHVDGGILYTVKELYSRPGHSIREYINGKRVKHFKPISLLIILATFYGFLYHYFDLNIIIDAENSNNDIYEQINHWMLNHFSWWTLATVPIFTIGTFICFRKQNYNFFELFILNTFKSSQRLILHIITFPFLIHFTETKNIHNFILTLYIIDILLIFWTNFQFFNNLKKIKVILLSILSHIIALTVITIILTTLILIMNNP